MEEKILACVQKIRTVLGSLGEVDVLQLSEHLAERSTVAYQALGWLASEGSVRYHRRHSQVFVSLAVPPGADGPGRRGRAGQGLGPPP